MEEPTKTLTARDEQVIWHPYTQHKTMAAPLPVVKGDGVYLVDENGNKYIDAISSWWTNLHGHAHPYIAQKIFEQAGQLEHVIFAGCTHEPAVQLAEKILGLLPENFSRIFYSDNGSTAVEVGIKMAIQYHKNKGQANRKKVLALTHAYHGDTFGAMSVSGRGVFTEAFNDLLFDVVFVNLPELHESPACSLPDLDPADIACFIYEPLVQGAGGMRMYHAEALQKLLTYCKQQGILCIADEVMTGFSRTGTLFASDAIPEKPDIICLSKGLTGGSLPLAITACTHTVFEAFLHNDVRSTFFHGHSFTANPLACAAALASLELLQQSSCQQAVAYLAEQNRQFVQHLQHTNYGQPILNARSLGTILAFELYSTKKEYLDKIKEETMEQALQLGVLLRPLGNTLYIMPPYCITAAQLEKVYATIDKLLYR